MWIKIVLLGSVAAGGILIAGKGDERTPAKPSQAVTNQATVQTPPQPSSPSENSKSDQNESSDDVATPLIAPEVSADEAAIRLVDEAFIKAYEAGDAKAAASYFTEDAEFVDETGTVFEGRDAIEACLTSFFEENPRCKLQIHVDAVRTISPGVVVQDGATIVLREDDFIPVECRCTSIYVKADGQWMVASVRDSAPHNLREHSTQLQQLDWLIGDWVDEGDDCIVNFSCDAVDNGNFLLREFTVVAGGHEAISGTQRIGWDPITGKLRTWIFDSEGAYGEGLWHQDPENDRWILKTTGVTADGQTASSTSIYSFVNDHTMTWQSVDYEIAGIQQPDSEVITIVRHSPEPTAVSAVEDSE